MTSLWSKRQSLVERYKNNSSKYTKFFNMLQIVFVVVVTLSVISLFKDEDSSILNSVFLIILDKFLGCFIL